MSGWGRGFGPRCAGCHPDRGWCSAITRLLRPSGVRFIVGSGESPGRGGWCCWWRGADCPVTAYTRRAGAGGCGAGLRIIRRKRWRGGRPGRICCSFRRSFPHGRIPVLGHWVRRELLGSVAGWGCHESRWGEWMRRGSVLCGADSTAGPQSTPGIGILPNPVSGSSCRSLSDRAEISGEWIRQCWHSF